MIQPGDIIYFEEHLKEMLAMSAREHIELNAYAQKEDASEKAIAVRDEAINKRNLFYQTCLAILDKIKMDNSQIRSEGYRQGYNDAQNFYEGTDLAWYNIEVQRIHSINNTKIKWEDHY